ncbi:WD40 repeat-like protein [Fomitiporia mediterranea MF3/22]|uniref:WD40 repeat-like protein n=1 Tax=Fomitiporia mediterranea (strain MF3/22) TaxID=694068 RepID=UPI0004408735|nr:WD40 repeat-like protein [Fomitiporia mediterranea MF3/22]EJD02322.1 WD40 repeat-like protein [Fomitiporia mediterranea MF3/22]
MLQGLGSVLYEESQTGVIRACHPSFLDFIGSARAKRYEVETAILDANMAKKCLDIMAFGLKFNICSLESSYLRNDEVPDLSERVDREISKQLQYSCLYWLDHLSRSQLDGTGRISITEKLREVFCRLKSLYWLEVLSLMSELKTAVSSLRDVPRLLKLISIDDELGTIMSDLYRFAMAFHEPMAVSASHIYISALLWAPSESVIAQLHRGIFTSSKLVLEGLEKHWPIMLRTLSVGSEVYSVAYSPDGRHIVSGSLDNAIHVWDAATGMPVGEPSQGHEKKVNSVVFAPNGCRIVSGSDDCTVRIWNVEAGTPLGEPLHGHKFQVLSVACSPDGCHVISGSWDKSIRIWNTDTGAPVGEPLRGHNGVVNCVAYSPDARYIVSGSYDSTVRVWDAATGRPVSRRLQGHSQQVSSVAYSSDGLYIASGSHDNTIRIWDTGSYKPVGEPFRGHKSAVNSIAYSRDGRRIVSGSADKTICIWDAKTGIPISEPLCGHEGFVESVSYSPDGRHIVSGSVDKTIRIWDTETVTSTLVPYTLEGQSVDATLSDLINLIRDTRTGELYQGHEDNTDPIAYSPDGRYSVTGSDGCTIHIWDIEMEAPVGEPLQGHNLPVCSVAFSPDSRHIVSGSEDATMRVWDVTTGGIIGAPLRGHEDRVHIVIYSPDGRHIVSASNDKSIRIWDAESSILAGDLDQAQDGWIGFSQDGKYTLTKSNRDNKLVRIPPFIHIDGWIRTSDSRLLLWVPHEYRNRVCDMSLASFSHYAPSHPVRIDWARLPHGTTWTSVKIDN